MQLTVCVAAIGAMRFSCAAPAAHFFTKDEKTQMNKERKRNNMEARRNVKKRFFALILALITCIAASLSVSAKPKTGHFVSREGWCYTLSDHPYPDALATIDGYEGTGSKLIIPDTVDGSKVTAIGWEAFKDRKDIREISIPEGVTQIDAYAFRNCTSLEKITLPDTLTIINDGAFYHCTALKSIALPAGITTISPTTFYECASLEEITLPQKLNVICTSAFGYCGKLSAVSLPTGLTKIEDEAFSCCSSLSDITIPQNVNMIGNSVFNECTSLDNINVDTDNSFFASADGVLYNKDASTLLCCPLTKTNLVLPSTVIEIAPRAFQNCQSLEQITLPTGLKTIGDEAFRLCTKLSTIALPEGIERISEYTFALCDALSQITIPRSVSEIRYDAFNGCFALTSVRYGGSEDEWNSIFVDGGNTPLENAKIKYNFNIHEYAVGDANGDGEVNARDITAIMRYLTGWHVSDFISEVSDANCDGKLNAKDIVHIMKLILQK